MGSQGFRSLFQASHIIPALLSSESQAVGQQGKATALSSAQEHMGAIVGRGTEKVWASPALQICGGTKGQWEGLDKEGAGTQGLKGAQKAPTGSG